MNEHDNLPDPSDMPCAKCRKPDLCERRGKCLDRAASEPAQPPQPDPVAWMDCWGEPHKHRKDAMQDDESRPTPLFEGPPQPLTLTDKQIDAMFQKWNLDWSSESSQGFEHLPVSKQIEVAFCDGVRAALAAAQPAQAEPVASPAAVNRALFAQGCERLLEWSQTGPVQRAAVEAFADALQAQAEPVAYRHLHEDGWEYYDAPTGEDCAGCQPLFTPPPQPLTLSKRIVELQAALMEAVAALEVVQEEVESLYPATISNALDSARAVLAAAQEGKP